MSVLLFGLRIDYFSKKEIRSPDSLNGNTMLPRKIAQFYLGGSQCVIVV